MGSGEEILPTDVLLPAPGQGALAVQCRSDDRAMRERLASHDDANTRVAVTAERALLHDLGASGPLWHPTSSLRTVYRADASVMLKLSLGLSITNSKRENLRKELKRGVEVHRLLEAGLGESLAAAHPGFEIVRDPGWLAVDLPDAPEPDSGLDLVLRQNPFGPKELVRCVAGLVAERPGAGPSMLAALVHGLAARSGRQLREVSREWFDRYLEAVAAPILWLYATHGIALEAHQQNTLVALNPGGWPVGGRYRDNQGYYFARPLPARDVGELVTTRAQLPRHVPVATQVAR